MATSQNGWPVYTSGSHPDLVAIPKVVGRVRRGDVATIFIYLVDRFDREVEDVDEGRDEWGYAYRAIRGKTSGYSNHASATALDLNAMQHPLGKVNTYTPAQRVALRRILNDLDGVVRWGGDYSGRKDEMHFEINASAAAVARVAAKIRAGSLVSRPITGGGSVTIPNIPGGIPAPAKDWFTMATQADLVAAVKKAFNSSDFRNQVYAAAWVNPRWTVPGTDRKENPAQFLSATRVASVQAVHAAGKAAGISDEDIERLVDALPTLTAEDVASQLTIGVKEN